jgi:hypothetical protein
MFSKPLGQVTLCLGIRFTGIFRFSERVCGLPQEITSFMQARLTENVMSNSDQKFNIKENAQRRDKELTKQADKTLLFPNNNISQLKNS